MLTRESVFALLDEERVRQNTKWGNLDERNNVADFILYMQRYLRVATDENNPAVTKFSLDAIRKATALGVACLERHGS